MKWNFFQMVETLLLKDFRTCFTSSLSIEISAVWGQMSWKIRYWILLSVFKFNFTADTKYDHDVINCDKFQEYSLKM